MPPTLNVLQVLPSLPALVGPAAGVQTIRMPSWVLSEPLEKQENAMYINVLLPGAGLNTTKRYGRSHFGAFAHDPQHEPLCFSCFSDAKARTIHEGMDG